MNCHTALQLHLSRHVYKRGAHRGEAPADKTRRAKSHFRVLKGNGGQMIVRFHGADILTAYEDGRITLNTNGWFSSPTTRSALGQALVFSTFGRMGSVRKFGMSAVTITARGRTYRYFDGMTFDADGKLLSDPLPFERKIVDRDETAEFRADIKASGFVDVFPLLYTTAVPSTTGNYYVRSKKAAVCDEDQAHHWPGIIADLKYPDYWARKNSDARYETHKEALRALIASFTKNMTVIVKSDVTVL